MGASGTCAKNTLGRAGIREHARGIRWVAREYLNMRAKHTKSRGDA